ncbi:MAG TPA: hypothetical protein VL651_11195 [Bacteroidia bacterium]|nr:hypothetical protein [Bacteroidia bacterium]
MIQDFASDLKKKDPFLLRLDSITHFLNVYDTLSPFDDGAYELIDSLQGEITGRMLSVLNDKRIVNYDIEKIWGDKIGIAVSPDKRVWYFTIDAKNGGSWHMMLSIFHCRYRNGKVEAYMDGNQNEGAAAYYFGSVYLVDSTRQKYIALGGLRTCNTCQSETAVVITLDSTYSIETLYESDSRYDDSDVFEYNDKTKIFAYAYSNWSDDPLYGGGDRTDDTKEFIYRYKGKFQYLDGEFIEIEKTVLTEPVKN